MAVDLNNLNDKQNMLLTQISYGSHYYTSGEMVGLPLSKCPPPAGTEEYDIWNQAVKAGLGDLVIKSVQHDYDTGFGAMAFTDSNGNTGISYRGSDGLDKFFDPDPTVNSSNDWIDNVIATTTGTSTQTEQAMAFYEKVCSSGDRVFLYGHSKGGNLSESVYVAHHDQIDGMHLLNPQPIHAFGLSLKQIAALRSEKVDIIVVQGDYVWFLGPVIAQNRIRVVEQVPGTNSHLFEAICWNGNDIQSAGQYDWDRQVAYRTGLLFGALELGGYIGNKIVDLTDAVYCATVRVVDYFQKDLIPKAKAFIADAVEFFKTKSHEFAEAFDNVMSEVYRNATSYYQKAYHVVKGVSMAVSTDSIRVDTELLLRYAEKLDTINQRIGKLDRDMDTLYKQVGFWDLWKLLRADLLTKESKKLTRCAEYLRNTAHDFVEAEYRVVQNGI